MKMSSESETWQSVEHIYIYIYIYIYIKQYKNELTPSRIKYTIFFLRYYITIFLNFRTNVLDHRIMQYTFQ